MARYLSGMDIFKIINQIPCKLHKTYYVKKKRQAFTMTNSMASSGLRKTVIFMKSILTTDDINGCVRSDTWYQRGFGTPWLEDHIYQCYMCNVTCVAHFPCVADLTTNILEAFT